MFEILIIVVILLVVFGAGKARSVGSDLGAAVKGFRKALGAPAAAVKADSADPAAPAAGTLPDAEFPEVIAARSRGSRKPDA